MGREAVGQQNAECVKFVTDFRKWFIIMSDTEYTNLAITEVLVFAALFHSKSLNTNAGCI